MLTDSQLQELRALLESRQEKISNNARKASSFSRDRDITRIGRDSIDLAAAEDLFGTQLRLADRESYIFTQITKALARMDSHHYGECEECEEPIAFPRLRARPMTTLCIPCQEEQEVQEVQEVQENDEY